MAGSRDLELMVEAGAALCAEGDPDRLPERILTISRELVRADAGALYLLQGKRLHPRALQNDTLKLRRTAPGEEIDLASLGLDRSTAAGYAALTGASLNIPDVYASVDFNFEETRRLDQRSGYRTRSLLAIPLQNRAGETLGVLELRNAKALRPGRFAPFSDRAEEMAVAFAAQAATALANAWHVLEVREMFEALVRVLAVAVDAKSPYTGNHIQRVALLNRMLAEAVSESDAPPFAKVTFDADELEAIRIAGWLHDVGKVITPAWIMDKATKLETIFDRVALVRQRFDHIKTLMEVEGLRALLARLGHDAEAVARSTEMTQARALMKVADEELRAVTKLNRPGETADERLLAQLERIAAKTYHHAGVDLPYLTADEKRNLTVPRGSLSDAELTIMRDHVKRTGEILAQIPFAASRRWKNVPLYAAQHHEKLNGTGYPHGLLAGEIPLPSRILAVADLYEALSSSTRPHKKGRKREVVHETLRDMAKAGEIDADVVELAIGAGVFERFEAAASTSP